MFRRPLHPSFDPCYAVKHRRIQPALPTLVRTVEDQAGFSSSASLRKSRTNLTLTHLRFRSNPVSRLKSASENSQEARKSPQASPRQIESLLRFIKHRPLFPQQNRSHLQV